MKEMVFQEGFADKMFFVAQSWWATRYILV